MLGDSVRSDGLEVPLFWLPGFVLREFRVADDSRFAATPISRLATRPRRRLRRLFVGRIAIDSLSFIEPEVQILDDETGLLNPACSPPRRRTRHDTPAPVQRYRPATVKAVRFAIDEIRVEDGRVIYLDRTVKDPAELQLRDVDVTLKNLDLARPTRVRAAASLTEGLP